MPTTEIAAVLTGPYERIARAIHELPAGATFGIREIRSRVPDVSRGTVNSFLRDKRKAGWLDHAARGHYRIGGIRVRTILPFRVVSDAVWAVLSTDPDRRSHTFPEIAGEAEVYIGRPGYNTYHQVAHVLYMWHRDGYLERTGPVGEYRYRLRDGVTEQPTQKHLRKS